MSKQTENTFYRTLKSPVFLVALTLLILNDHLFKYQFHNFLTGKLSDFAGLLCFGLFWIGLFPKQAKGILFLIGISFIFWKSEFSTSSISWINEHSFFHFNRVIDYGDLFALVMLPVAYHQLQSILKDERRFQFRMSPVLPLLLASVTFVATSEDEPVIGCYGGSYFEVPFPKEELEQRMKENFYTDARGFDPNSDETSLEYLTTICDGELLRVQVTVITIYVTDSTSLLAAPDICLDCESFLLEGDLTDDFEERVVNVILGN